MQRIHPFPKTIGVLQKTRLLTEPEESSLVTRSAFGTVTVGLDRDEPRVFLTVRFEHVIAGTESIRSGVNR